MFIIIYIANGHLIELDLSFTEVKKWNLSFWFKMVDSDKTNYYFGMKIYGKKDIGTFIIN